jgi:histidine triad (HIT) family protein
VPHQDAPACAFCEVANGAGPAQLVFEDDGALAFLDRRPLLKGHCLLVPRRHYGALDDVPAPEIGPLFHKVQWLAAAVEKAMAADGSFVAINTRVSQSVPHLHVHVVPRWQGDGLFSPKLVWKRRPYRDDTEMKAVRDAIRAALETT